MNPLISKEQEIFKSTPAKGGKMNSSETKGMNVPANRMYKDTIFRMLYRDKKNLLNLYNALNDTDYTDENDLEIITLENAIYMSMKNDLAFVLDFRMYLYEHQSTHNPNIPLRDLFYVSSEYQKLVEKSSLYASRRVLIPAPRFVVFYNGTDERPEREFLKLSDLYTTPEEEPLLELQVLMLNINAGHNQELKERCQTLHEYMLYVERIRTYIQEGITLQKAVERAVDECISEGILEEFLRANRAEAINVSIFEYDEEKEIRLYRNAEREVGKDIGLSVLVKVLKKEGKTAEEIYQEVVMHEEYHDVTREKIEECYNCE